MVNWSFEIFKIISIRETHPRSPWLDGEDSQKHTIRGLRIKILKDCNTMFVKNSDTGLLGNGKNKSSEVANSVGGRNVRKRSFSRVARSPKCVLHPFSHHRPTLLIFSPPMQPAKVVFLSGGMRGRARRANKGVGFFSRGRAQQENTWLHAETHNRITAGVYFHPRGSRSQLRHSLCKGKCVKNKKQECDPVLGNPMPRLCSVEAANRKTTRSCTSVIMEQRRNANMGETRKSHDNPTTSGISSRFPRVVIRERRRWDSSPVPTCGNPTRARFPHVVIRERRRWDSSPVITCGNPGAAALGLEPGSHMTRARFPHVVIRERLRWDSSPVPTCGNPGAAALGLEPGSHMW
ncbi:hypothetical protein PR048_014231 [Dryococelus australis]|uniref:Uncharacterized protein n=1 Tax=Dryococelus australis TaxID=614101 RepID=A0ABQ9HDM6_9NEOP|nr:hypothetical protein PR048_014231 [Dryococelus australis]